ncbi:MAG: methionine--tRNA ligase [Legionellales bacterium]|nr:methionine--tRNA ligase [Legionellales bacterium]
MSDNIQRQICVTMALPYANGDLHLGHLVEAIQSDIWVRFQRHRGNNCSFFCGSDAHGTPIMLQAQKKGITPEALVAQAHEQRVRIYSAFNVDFTNYHTTHSSENRTLAEDIYTKLKSNGDISRKSVEQFYDTEKQMFLPDRFVKGTCPKCGAQDQYGDNCEVCGASYHPTDLKDVKSSVSGTTPVLKSSDHLFFEIARYQTDLQNWLETSQCQTATINKLNEWLSQPLHPWDISRDGPYFGFEIPEEENKFFYVWLDAPIGYMASMVNWANAHDHNDYFKAVWNHDSDVELYHFIGKDIVYFHTLFWPAMLKGADYRLPTAVWAHGFLTINGHKMSKSRGTFITADAYLHHVKDPDYLRHYFASKLTDTVDDIDLDIEDFKAKVNSDLVGKLVNIASRCAGFLKKQFDNRLLDPSEETLYQQFINARETIASDFESRNFAKAIREIMALADDANRFIDANKPWLALKDPEQHEEVHRVCSLGLQLFRILMTYLKPVVPGLTEKAEALFGETFTWAQLEEGLRSTTINSFKPLLPRIESAQLESMMDEVKLESQDNKSDDTPKTGHLADEPIAETIDYDTFLKVDLRVAKIVEASAVEGADKLLCLKLDIGGEIRQVFAGIKSAYKPETLVGKHTVMVANLAPRKMRFGMSEGMVLAAAGTDKNGLYILEPHEGAEPGMRVR